MGICNTSAKQDLGGPDESSKNEDYDLDYEITKNTVVVYYEAECKKYLKSLDLLKSINVKPTVHCITQSNQAKALRKSLKKLTGNSSLLIFSLQESIMEV